MRHEKVEQALRKVNDMLLKYKYALLILLIGVSLLILGGGSKPTEQTSAQPEQETTQGSETFDLDAFENKLETSLSAIQGAGRVHLTLSLKSTDEAVYAADIRQAQQGKDSSSYESSLAMVSDSGYGQKPVLVKNMYPVFRGALVLCDGADDNTVRLAVTQAVSTMCGLGTDKISVLKLAN